MTEIGPTYPSEVESAAALDQLLIETGMFRIYREVTGTLLHPRPDTIPKRMRIDRILLPTDRLVLAGWRSGILGVEIKRDPYSTLTPGISQALDYTRSVFTIDNGYQVIPTYVFLWPMLKQHGPVASILAQNRLGSIQDYGNRVRLQFNSGEASILRIYRDGLVEIGDCAAGRKAGSR